jgi:multidrug transporter EmrE-like cation transporter
MTTLASLTARTILMFLFVVATQIIGSSLLARTDGFRVSWMTALCLAVYVVSFWVLAMMIKEGAPLSTLMPLLAATVPLAIVAVGVFFYGEAASWPRIGMLVTACLMVGAASAI